MKPPCKAALIFAVALGFSNPVFAKAICASLPEPQATFHGMAMETFSKFDDERLGISLTYFSRNERLSIFKYDHGLTKIDTASLAKHTNQAFKNIDQMAKIEGGKVEELVKIGQTSFVGFPFSSFLLLVSTKGGLKFEFVGIGSDGECITKVRFSYSKDENPIAAAERYVMYLDALKNYVSGN